MYLEGDAGGLTGSVVLGRGCGLHLQHPLIRRHEQFAHDGADLAVAYGQRLDEDVGPVGGTDLDQLRGGASLHAQHPRHGIAAVDRTHKEQHGLIGRRGPDQQLGPLAGRIGCLLNRELERVEAEGVCVDGGGIRLAAYGNELGALDRVALPVGKETGDAELAGLVGFHLQVETSLGIGVNAPVADSGLAGGVVVKADAQQAQGGLAGHGVAIQRAGCRIDADRVADVVEAAVGPEAYAERRLRGGGAACAGDGAT